MFPIAVLVSILGLATCTSIPKAPPSNRIVGGYEVPIKDIPYQVSLHNFHLFFCGGSILSQTAILTAAHCTEGLSASHLSVRVGSHLRNFGGTSYRVEKIVTHESYDPSTADNDVSILKLKHPLVYGEKVQAVVLADSNFIPTDGVVATVSGWGTTSETGIYSLILLAVQVKLLSETQCKSLGYPPSEITSQMICAADIGKDSCMGDSGGPLVSGGKQVGIVSWGMGCARPNYPGVYASVSALRNWIDSKLSTL